MKVKSSDEYLTANLSMYDSLLYSCRVFRKTGKPCPIFIKKMKLRSAFIAQSFNGHINIAQIRRSGSPTVVKTANS